jgi:hypothetical protein
MEGVMTMDKTIVELLARRAGLDKALAQFPEDVAAAAKQASDSVTPGSEYAKPSRRRMWLTASAKWFQLRRLRSPRGPALRTISRARMSRSHGHKLRLRVTPNGLPTA